MSTLGAEDQAMLIRRFGAKARYGEAKWASANMLWAVMVVNRVPETKLKRLRRAWLKAIDGDATILDALVKKMTADYPSNILRRR